MYISGEKHIVHAKHASKFDSYKRQQLYYSSRVYIKGESTATTEDCEKMAYSTYHVVVRIESR